MEQVDNFKGHSQSEADDSYSVTGSKAEAFAGYVATEDKTGEYKAV